GLGQAGRTAGGRVDAEMAIGVAAVVGDRRQRGGGVLLVRAAHLERVERRVRGSRAVVLVGEEDDRQLGVGAQEAGVLDRHRRAVGAERARDGRELLLEPAPLLAEPHHALEHGAEVTGVVGDAAGVGEERLTRAQAGARPDGTASATVGAAARPPLPGSAPRPGLQRYTTPEDPLVAKIRAAAER